MQASIALYGDDARIGIWNDLENGRADRTIWNLPIPVQDVFYPLMDRFYSIATVEQPALSNEEEDWAHALRGILPALSLYGRYACARAILSGASEIYTLVSELLQNDVCAHMSERYGICIIRPSAEVEQPYLDALLEERYQNALATFKAFNVNPMQVLADKRPLYV